jgi:hypothetical protein
VHGHRDPRLDPLLERPGRDDHVVEVVPALVAGWGIGDLVV